MDGSYKRNICIAGGFGTMTQASINRQSEYDLKYYNPVVFWKCIGGNLCNLVYILMPGVYTRWNFKYWDSG